MVRTYFIFFSLLLAPILSVAQSLTVRGYIKDAATGEFLFGANVYAVPDGPGAISNEEGYYEMKVPLRDSISVRFSYIGFIPQIVAVNTNKDTTLTIALKPDHHQLREVVVAAKDPNPRYRSSLMNVNYLSAADIELSPGVLGETDLIKVLQLKPGMQGGNEGSSGFVVRGGQADQNLVLLDGVPVYNPTHLLGLFSVFSSDAINDVKLYKGGFPARFGGRLASVLDVGLRSGSKEKLKVKGGTGLISSRLTVEGPLVKDKVSFLVSGRRTYFDLITKEINEANAGKEDYQPIPDYYFYDLTAKLHAQLSTKDQLSFTGYAGRDHFDFDGGNMAFRFLWGNKVGILQWKHAYNKKLTHNMSVSYSDYQYRIRHRYNNMESSVGSGINDFIYKNEFFYELNRRHTVSAGLQFTYHIFDVLRQENMDNEGPLKLRGGNKDQVTGREAAAFIADSWQVSDRLSLEAGIRVSGFHPGSQSSDVYVDDVEENDDEKVKAATARVAAIVASPSENGEGLKGYIGIEPRFSARFQAGENLALKASYSRANQYVHMVSSSGASLPSDFWYPSNDVIRPQIATQYAAGGDLLLADGRLLLSNELYYRNMDNQIDFRDGAELFNNHNVTDDLVFGNGWAYGNEFYLEKKNGKTTGWIGYTLSWSYRKFEEINGGSPFPSGQDRRHDFSFVIRREISQRVSFSGNWVFCTGNVTTLPQARATVQGNLGANALIVPVYAERNSFRQQSYHRLDLGFVYDFEPRWGDADLKVGVYNAYNRRNPYFIYFENVPAPDEGAMNFTANQVSLFPVLPSVSFNYSF